MITIEELAILDADLWEPPKRNILPDELEEEGLEEDWGYEELNFEDEV